MFDNIISFVEFKRKSRTDETAPRAEEAAQRRQASRSLVSPNSLPLVLQQLRSQTQFNDDYLQEADFPDT
jgi:hypothetical protein